MKNWNRTHALLVVIAVLLGVNLLRHSERSQAAPEPVAAPFADVQISPVEHGFMMFDRKTGGVYIYMIRQDGTAMAPVLAGTVRAPPWFRLTTSIQHPCAPNHSCSPQ